MISYSDFQNVEMKVAKVESVEKVEGTDKLYKIDIDCGEKRTIVSGIADQYAPEDLLGKNIVVITNLEPRKIRGVESNGMLLAAEDEAGIVSLLVPIRDIAPGTKVH